MSKKLFNFVLKFLYDFPCNPTVYFGGKVYAVLDKESVPLAIGIEFRKRGGGKYLYVLKIVSKFFKRLIDKLHFFKVVFLAVWVEKFHSIRAHDFMKGDRQVFVDRVFKSKIMVEYSPYNVSFKRGRGAVTYSSPKFMPPLW